MLNVEIECPHCKWTFFTDSTMSTNTGSRASSVTHDSTGQAELGRPDPRALMDAMQQTLKGIDSTFIAFNEQSTAFNANIQDPKMDVTTEIRGIHKRLRDHGRSQDRQIRDAKKILREDFKKDISDRLREDIRKQVRREIVDQVKDQVDLQIQEHIPVSLEQQAKDSKQQITEIKISLENSEARMKNTTLDATSLDEPLAPILKLDGTKSVLYPADLRSLFSYDCAMTQALVQDFNLAVGETLQENYNRFMRHIDRYYLSAVEYLKKHGTSATRRWGNTM